jgi:hypothetical protein
VTAKRGQKLALQVAEVVVGKGPEVLGRVELETALDPLQRPAVFLFCREHGGNRNAILGSDPRLLRQREVRVGIPLCDVDCPQQPVELDPMVGRTCLRIVTAAEHLLDAQDTGLLSGRVKDGCEILLQPMPEAVLIMNHPGEQPVYGLPWVCVGCLPRCHPAAEQ